VVVVVVVAVVVAGLLLAGCGGSAGAGGGSSSGRVAVVTSTDVWASVVRAVGGADVDVHAAVTDPAQDPHSFEASSRTLLAVSRADVVVENGGGYDDFLDRMLDTSSSKARVVDAVDVSGLRAAHGGDLNEHVWYDLRTVQKVAARVATELGRVDRAHASAYAARATRFSARVQRLVAREAAVREQVGGRSIGVTEPVPLYLTEACGLRDATPAAFSRAVEAGEDVSPAVLQQTLDLYSRRGVAALVYNRQTAGPVTEKVLSAARNAGVPVVPVTETLPAGQDYVGWMRDTIARLAAAVGS
jgi:zinc/manganese transport system substrate-binding protein